MSLLGASVALETLILDQRQIPGHLLRDRGFIETEEKHPPRDGCRRLKCLASPSFRVFSGKTSQLGGCCCLISSGGSDAGHACARVCIHSFARGFIAKSNTGALERKREVRGAPRHCAWLCVCGARCGGDGAGRARGCVAKCVWSRSVSRRAGVLRCVAACGGVVRMVLRIEQ